MRSCASWYERSSSSSSGSMLPAIAGPRLALESCGQADFRDASERLRDGAVLLRLLRRLLEGCFVQPRDLSGNIDGDLRDALARLERHGGRGLQLLRGMALLGQPARERHREARGVRCGDQLFRARQPARLFGAGRPAHLEAAERATGHGVDTSAATHQISAPRHLCLAIGRHCILPSSVPCSCYTRARGYAITSTLRASGSLDSSERTSFSARIETSI